MTSLHDIKARFSEDGESTSAIQDGSTTEGDESETDPAPAEESEDESSEAEKSDDADEPEAKPKPASSGEAHQPKTDTEIDEGGSLFDL